LHEGQTPGAESPSADRVIVIALDIDNASIIQIGDQTAAQGAFLTDGPDPPFMFFPGTRIAIKQAMIHNDEPL
jgi:hypothetical protein